jgi:hypothetical protein
MCVIISAPHTTDPTAEKVAEVEEAARQGPGPGQGGAAAAAEVVDLTTSPAGSNFRWSAQGQKQMANARRRGLISGATPVKGSVVRRCNSDSKGSSKGKGKGGKDKGKERILAGKLAKGVACDSPRGKAAACPAGWTQEYSTVHSQWYWR